jgi:hypothetical protein
MHVCSLDIVFASRKLGCALIECGLPVSRASVMFTSRGILDDTPRWGFQLLVVVGQPLIPDRATGCGVSPLIAGADNLDFGRMTPAYTSQEKSMASSRARRH